MDHIYRTYDEGTLMSIFGKEICDGINNGVTRPKCRIVVNFNKRPFRDVDGTQHLVISPIALLTDPQQKVYYLLKWDSVEARPGGNHLGQQVNNYEGRFVEDKDAQGRIITSPDSTAFYNGRLVFFFNDNIVQQGLRGVWTFKVLVVDNQANTILAEDSVSFDWDTL